MKLLMTADTIGGVWTYSMALCKALQPHGVHVALATMGRELSPEQRRQVAELPHVQLFESTYRLCWMQDAWEDVEQAGEWLLSLERTLCPDVIHLNDLAHGGLHWQAPVLLVAHSCVLSWWEAVKKQPAPTDEWARYQSLVRASVQRADLVAAPTLAMLTTIRQHYGPAHASRVVFNGRDFPPLFSSPRAKTAEPMIFAAGRLWDDAKNIAALTTIAEQLPWPVCVAGEHEDPNGGSRRHEGVRCLGHLSSDQMAQWLKRATIYVAPAHYEPFGLAILEAARAGCALVLGDIPSLREIWGDAADYVNPNDPDALQQAISTLIDNPERRQEMASRAWQRAQRYTSNQVAHDYMHCYHALYQERVVNCDQTSPKHALRTQSAHGHFTEAPL